MTDRVREWAKVKLALREASDRVLKAEGHTWQSLKELESEAISQLAAEAFVDTEYGRVQIVNRPVWEQKNPKVIATNRSLKLTERV